MHVDDTPTDVSFTGTLPATRAEARAAALDTVIADTVKLPSPNIKLESTEVPAVNESGEAIDTRTPEQIAEDEAIMALMNRFVPPPNFLFCMPNQLIGTFSKFVRATDDPSTLPKTTAEAKQAEYTEALIERYQSEYALFFAAHDMELGIINFDDWQPVHVPDMERQAKLVLVHRKTFDVIKGNSMVIEHYPSLRNRHLADVRAIYVLPPDGAEMNYALTERCAHCSLTPSPVKCEACGTRYCLPACRTAHRDAHQPECVAKITLSMKATVERERLSLNTRADAFLQKQAAIAERNRGKLVTVVRRDADGKEVRTQEIVVPELTTPALDEMS